MTRRRVVRDEQDAEAKQFTTITTGGPMKYYNRRRVRRAFADKLKLPPFVPIGADWYQEIIRKIIDERQRQGITQVDLARTLGTTQSAISLLESGRANPTVEFLDRVLNTLKLSLEINIEQVKK